MKLLLSHRLLLHNLVDLREPQTQQFFLLGFDVLLCVVLLLVGVPVPLLGKRDVAESAAVRLLAGVGSDVHVQLLLRVIVLLAVRAGVLVWHSPRVLDSLVSQGPRTQ